MLEKTSGTEEILVGLLPLLHKVTDKTKAGIHWDEVGKLVQLHEKKKRKDELWKARWKKHKGRRRSGN